MNQSFSSHLTSTQISDILKLYQRMDIVSIEQFPGFAKADTDSDVWHYIQTDADSEVIAYAQISVRPYRIASISFGPIAISEDTYKNAIIHIKEYCSKKLIPILRIVPPYFISTYGESYYNDLKKVLSFENSDQEINWSTMLISITPSEEDILKSFSDNHKRSIKKALKMELHVRVIRDQQTVKIFSDQHSDMYENRGLKVDRDKDCKRFSTLFDFFEKNDLGLFLMVYDKDTPIGGIYCAIQGAHMRYMEGYSHPEYRQYPVTHIAFFEAIRIAKQKGLQYFDMGGYANNVAEGDQLSAINRFKDGFKGELIDYPQTMLLYTSPISKLLYKLYKKIR